MNRIKSKENINPNIKALSKGQENYGIKTRNQSRALFKENPNNPQRSSPKNNLKKKQSLKQSKDLKKIQEKVEPLQAQLYYEKEIISLIKSEATKKFKKSKKLQENNQYKYYRECIISQIYRECQRLNLKTETFYLYIHFLDTFMKTEDGKRLSMQNCTLASYTCFFMAQKYEEIYPPSISEWLPQNLHENVYKWEGKIIFALKFKFIHESIYDFFCYWSLKYKLNGREKQSCRVVIESIVFNYDLMYRYEPHKISKVLVLMQIGEKKQKTKSFSSLNTFECVHEKNKIIEDIINHIVNSGAKITWIESFKS